MPVRSQTYSLDEPTLTLSFNFSKYPKAKTIGDNIRNRRLSCSLKQRELARILGVSEATVTNWEKGYTKPRPDLYDRLIQYLIS